MRWNALLSSNTEKVWLVVHLSCCVCLCVHPCVSFSCARMPLCVVYFTLLVCVLGDNCASGSGEACTNVTDDALFRDKLKHMGKCKNTQSVALWAITKSFSQCVCLYHFKIQNVIRTFHIGHVQLAWRASSSTWKCKWWMLKDMTLSQSVLQKAIGKPTFLLSLHLNEMLIRCFFKYIMMYSWTYAFSNQNNHIQLKKPFYLIM